jgi:hypothetical protein
LFTNINCQGGKRIEFAANKHLTPLNKDMKRSLQTLLTEATKRGTQSPLFANNFCKIENASIKLELRLMRNIGTFKKTGKTFTELLEENNVSK